VKERKLKKAQIYSIWGFSIIAIGGIVQLFLSNQVLVCSILIVGLSICFFALIKAIKNFK
jgi:VIT1/CCC1 family predicted Fe2+/Mn2+ transporter